MRELTGKKIEIDEEIIKCDFCEGMMVADFKHTNGLEHSATLTFSFGYFSNRDGDNWNWDACHKCADEIAKMLEKFKKESK